MVLSNNKIIIREARLSDSTRLASLMSELGHPISNEDMLHNLNIYLANPMTKIFVAESDSQVVAMISLIIFPLINRVTNYARISSLIVSTTERSRGIGGMLLEYTEAYAIRNKCDKIELTSGLHRSHTGAYEFYRERGYKSDQTTYFIKKLEGIE